jgi:hypothetical protein
MIITFGFQKFVLRNKRGVRISKFGAEHRLFVCVGWDPLYFAIYF